MKDAFDDGSTAYPNHLAHFEEGFGWSGCPAQAWFEGFRMQTTHGSLGFTGELGVSDFFEFGSAPVSISIAAI